jgi:hypothetical protein
MSCKSSIQHEENIRYQLASLSLAAAPALLPDSSQDTYRPFHSLLPPANSRVVSPINVSRCLHLKTEIYGSGTLLRLDTA